MASAILAALLAARIYRERLQRIYPMLFTFLLFDVARTLASLTIQQGTSMSAYVFIGTEPVAWILNFMMVREIFHIVLHDHPGIDSASRGFIRYAMAFSVAASVALLWMDYVPASGLARLLQWTFLFGRVALLALVVLLIAAVVFMSWFPVTITRNASILVTGYVIYFSSKGLLLLVRNMAGAAFNTAGGIAMLCVFIACLAAGGVLLKSANEARQGEFRPPSDPEEASRLLAQLERINRKLEESAKR